MCIRVVDYLATQPSKSLQRLSFKMLSEAAGAKSLDELSPVIRYLTGAAVPILELRFEFIDGDVVARLDPEVVARARKAQVFHHPETGAVVPDFESKIFLHFAVSAEGEALRSIL